MVRHAQYPVAGLAMLMLVGCVEPRWDPESAWVEGEPGVWRQGLTVGEAGGCSTAIVAGLSRQIIREVNCLRPNTLVDFSDLAVDASDTVWQQLQAAAKEGLAAAIRQHGGRLPINSALRTLPQQYLLYRWYLRGQCGIQLAARPGRSAHESGLAIDTSAYASWRAALENHGWDWYGNSDAVHFTFVGGGTIELTGLSVEAFQRLWNRNHPEDPIDVDGDYGPQTEARLERSPADGFPLDACADEPPPPAYAASFVGQDHPARMTSGEEAVAWVEYRNDGTATWSLEQTFLGTTEPRDRPSPFFAAGNWSAPQRASPPDHSNYTPGVVGRFTFLLRAPEVQAPTRFVEHWGLVQEGVTWFGPADGAVFFDITVDPRPGVDADGDGHAAPPTGEDCDDGVAGIHPAAPEICGDGVDQDCDGQDQACPPDSEADAGTPPDPEADAGTPPEPEEEGDEVELDAGQPVEPEGHPGDSPDLGPLPAEGEPEGGAGREPDPAEELDGLGADQAIEGVGCRLIGSRDARAPGSLILLLLLGLGVCRRVEAGLRAGTGIAAGPHRITVPPRSPFLAPRSSSPAAPARAARSRG